MIHSPDLSMLDGIAHGFFTRHGGVSEGAYATLNCGLGSGDYPAHVAENRRRVAEAVGTKPEALLTCYQIHSPDVVRVTAPWDAAGRPEADAMVTNRAGIALGILTADCAPVLFADPLARVIGAAHAGWRGALTGILEATIESMCELGAHPARIVAAIGPCIWHSSYEVGPDFPAPFVAENPAHQAFFTPASRAGHYLFDLPGYVQARLENLGLATITPSPADTFADADRFFSHRRLTLAGGGDNGRLISAICLAL